MSIATSANTLCLLRQFDALWQSLSPREKTRVVQLLVAGVDYDGATGKVTVTFQPSGIKALMQQVGEAA